MWSPFVYFVPFSFDDINDSCFRLGLRSNETKRHLPIAGPTVEVKNRVTEQRYGGAYGVGWLITEEAFYFGVSSVFLCLDMCSTYLSVLCDA